MSVPPRSAETWSSSKSSTLIRSAPSAWKIPARTPGGRGCVSGRGGACPGRRMPSRASGAGARSPRRSSAPEPASPPASASSTCSRWRRCSASVEGLAVVEEDVDPDPRVGAADARHVRQRAARGLERVVPVDPRRARLVEEDVREDVRGGSSPQRGGRGRPGRSRRGALRAPATNPWTSRSRSGSVAAVGVRNHVAPSKARPSPAPGRASRRRRSGGRRRSARSPPAAADTAASWSRRR